jgi:hypothetical protein
MGKHEKFAFSVISIYAGVFSGLLIFDILSAVFPDSEKLYAVNEIWPDVYVWTTFSLVVASVVYLLFLALWDMFFP